jgi:hypothetical protein
MKLCRRCFLLFIALLVSCGGAAPQPAVAPPPPAPKPRNAAVIAQSIAGGKVSALLYAERARGHAITTRLVAMDLWGAVLEGTGIDPQRDLVRAFVTAPSVRAEQEAVAVLEHTLPPDKLQVGVDALLARSDPPGSRLDGLGAPAVRVTVRGHTRIVAIIEPSFLVVLPEAKASEAKRFVGTGGFPDPTGKEAAVLAAVDPAHSLKAPRAPKVPRTIASLNAVVTLAEDGGAHVDIEGVSASPEQAQTDAGELTEAVDRATTLRVSIVRLRVFDSVTFVAEGDRVKAKRHVTPGEVDKIFGLLSALLPR